MSVLRQRLCRKNAAGEYDIIHFETSSDLVRRPDGTDLETAMVNFNQALNTKADDVEVQQALQSKADSNHTHTGYAAYNHGHNLADLGGILPINKGGTGADSLDTLKTALGVSGGRGSSYDIGNIGIGNIVKWANNMWIICHIDDNAIYLAATFIQGTTKFGFTAAGVYAGSTLAQVAKDYENSIPADSLSLAIDTTVNGVTAKIFVPSYEQMIGGFSYFFSNSNRMCTVPMTASGSTPVQRYWTSSYRSESNGGWVVNEEGAMFNLPWSNYTNSAYNFRPFVALRK